MPTETLTPTPCSSDCRVYNRQMTLDPSIYVRELRGTRARPPGAAADTPVRQAIYTSALQQFEELLLAAKVSGPASRPLPLFYAFTQAGKAIVAAHGSAPDTRGHGLREFATQADHAPSQLLARAVERVPKKDRSDTFSRVVEATGSGDLPERAQIGAIWAAIPGTPRLPRESWKNDWRTCLSVHEVGNAGRFVIEAFALEDPIDVVSEHVRDVGSQRYPGLPAGATVMIKEPEVGTRGMIRAYATWSDPSVAVNNVGEPTGGELDRVLRPLLPGQDKLSSPFLLWWTLIFGFSVLARYEPAVWQESLRVDSAEIAVSLEWILETALRELPRLVYDAVTGSRS